MAKYGITYHIKFHPEGLAIDDLPDDAGACDRIVAISIIDREDGGTSYMALTTDRDNQPLSPIEIFKAWLALGEQCSVVLEDGWCKNLCEAVKETVTEKVDEVDMAEDVIFGPMLGTMERGEA